MEVKMEEIMINEKISYIASSDDPLSADIGIIRNAASTWLFDVGNDKRAIRELTGNYTVVLSHFHKDHTGNLDKLNVKDVFVSSETKRHVQTGTIIDRDRYIDHLHLFPLPSSHCKGCLGLEVDETYAFVGDALYCRSKDGYYIFNVQLLKDEILPKSALPGEGFQTSEEKARAETNPPVSNSLPFSVFPESGGISGQHFFFSGGSASPGKY